MYLEVKVFKAEMKYDMNSLAVAYSLLLSAAKDLKCV
jgi:hypothetical protein